MRQALSTTQWAGWEGLVKTCGDRCSQRAPCNGNCDINKRYSGFVIFLLWNAHDQSIPWGNMKTGDCWCEEEVSCPKTEDLVQNGQPYRVVTAPTVPGYIRFDITG